MTDQAKNVDPEERFWAIIAWLRRNLLVIIFAGMLALQFLTWRVIIDLRRYFPGEPPDCDFYHPCHVVIDKP
jgi:hypothetical protein